MKPTKSPTYTGDGTFTLDLQSNREDTVTRIHIRGSTTGSVQVNGWIVDSDRKESLGTLDLTQRGNMVCKDLALNKLEFVATGTVSFNALVTQGSL